MATGLIGTTFRIGVSTLPGPDELGVELDGPPVFPGVGDFPIGDGAIAGRLYLPRVAPPIPFFVIEVTTYDVTTRPMVLDMTHGGRPHGALVLVGEPRVLDTLRASDVGYRTRSADTGGVVVYPPVLNQAFQIDTAWNLDPAASGVAAAWGAALLWNGTRAYDAMVATRYVDGQAVRVLYGQKVFDPVRQYWADPPYADLALVFSGQAMPWYLTDTALTIPLRDVSYWLERPYQTVSYRGTGGLAGTATLAGHYIPRTRGGTTADPVRNVTPTLVDPVHLIWQYNDARGSVVHLYEGGAEVFTYDGDTTDLYAPWTAPGHYRTDNSRGLFQLGSSPVHAITADVTGEFPAAGVVTIWSEIARYMMLEDLGLPLANINAPAFAAAAAAYPYEAGYFFGTDANVTGVAALEVMFAGVGAKLVPDADGLLRPLVPRLPTSTPLATFSSVNIITPEPVPLPSGLSPPPTRFRVGYAVNHTVQTSDLNTASATAAHLALVGQGYEVATSAPVLGYAWARPNDPPVIVGALLKAADAALVAGDLMDLFGVRRRLLTVSAPIQAAMNLDLGDVVTIRYALDDMDNGKDGQIVRRTFTMGDAVGSFQVLI